MIAIARRVSEPVSRTILTTFLPLTSPPNPRQPERREMMDAKMIAAGEYMVTLPSGQELKVKRDRYMGGWLIWCTHHMKWTDMRFGSKKDALAHIERFAA
jgi:hypothetical protein